MQEFGSFFLRIRDSLEALLENSSQSRSLDVEDGNRGRRCLTQKVLRCTSFPEEVFFCLRCVTYPSTPAPRLRDFVVANCTCQSADVSFLDAGSLLPWSSHRPDAARGYAYAGALYFRNNSSHDEIHIATENHRQLSHVFFVSNEFFSMLFLWEKPEQRTVKLKSSKEFSIQRTSF